MLGAALEPEIRDLLASKKLATLKQALGELSPADMAELLEEFEGEDQAVLFRLLGSEAAAEVVAYLERDSQEELFRRLSQASVARIFNEMAPDDRTDLLEDLPGELAQRLLNTLRGEERQIADTLMNYPPDSVGRLMTPEYVAVRPDWTAQHVLSHIRSVAPQKETVHHIYVVDDRWKLLAHLGLDELILAQPDETLRDIVDGATEPACLNVRWDREEAVELFKKYDTDALPVVDGKGVMVGIVTGDDVLDVMEEEDTEDFQKMAGLYALGEGYFLTSQMQMLRKRLPWLTLLFFAELLTALAIFGFENGMGENLLLFVLFMPLINASAGNAGSQMAGLVIRGLAVQEMELEDWLRVARRELGIGLALGLSLAAMGLVTPLLFGRPIYVAITLSTSLLAAVTVANLTGAMTPFALKRLGADPAVTSSPLIASVMDVLSVVIYYGTAGFMLSQFGQSL